MFKKILTNRKKIHNFKQLYITEQVIFPNILAVSKIKKGGDQFKDK